MPYFLKNLIHTHTHTQPNGFVSLENLDQLFLYYIQTKNNQAVHMLR